MTKNFFSEGTDNSLLEVASDVSKTGEVSAGDKDPVVIVGLDSGTVVGIAFAAFIIGAIMMGALWFIHTHSGKCKLPSNTFFTQICIILFLIFHQPDFKNAKIQTGVLVYIHTLLIFCCLFGKIRVMANGLLKKS